MTFAFVFPGQGSQSVGMLNSISERPEVRATLQEASEALGEDVAKLIEYLFRYQNSYSKLTKKQKDKYFYEHLQSNYLNLDFKLEANGILFLKPEGRP